MDIYIFWTILSLLFLITELFIPSAFSFLFISFAGAITSALCFILGLSWLTSTVLFTLLTMGLLTLFHKRYRSHWAMPNNDDINNTLSRLIDSCGQVISINNEVLRIKIGSHYWSALKKHKDSKIVLNSLVRVVGYKKMTLLVVPVESSAEI